MFTPETFMFMDKAGPIKIIIQGRRVDYNIIVGLQLTTLEPQVSLTLRGVREAMEAAKASMASLMSSAA